MHKITQENLIGLKIKGYTYISLIGQGNYGRVYKAFNEKTSESVAAKVMPKELFKRTPKLLELVKTQIKVLKDCRNDNVVKYVDDFMTDKSIVIVMELCDGGQLQQYLNKKERLTEGQATIFLKQIINGFKGLHQVDAMHRDFKAQNVLLHQNQCKIADLGFAKQVKEEGVTATLVGTMFTMAPEVSQGKKYGRIADIWSIGIVYYQLIFGEYPFKGHSNLQILKKIKQTRPSYQKVNISEKAKDFIEKCLTVDCKKRISWKQIYSHPIMNEQQKIRYGLKSNIKICNNISFYDKQTPQEQNGKNISDFEIVEQKNIEKNEDINNIIKQCQLKDRIQILGKKYENEYLNRLNNIMFIFKYIVPSIIDIRKKYHANHTITLFIMCKKAYQDMKKYNLEIRSKSNIFGFKQLFEEFTQSWRYKQFIQLIQSDLQLILEQSIEYYKILPQNLNGEILKQLNIEVINHSNWEQYVLDVVDSYENELIQKLDNVCKDQKKEMIKLIQGLYYYRTYGLKSQIQQFDKYIEGLSYEDTQVKLRQRWLKKISEC